MTVSRIAAELLRLLLPHAFFFGQFDLMKRWLACQRVTLAPFICMLVSVVIHLALCLLYVKVFGLGVRGVCLAAASKDFLLWLTLTFYCLCANENI